jgi:hypothetical protein
MPIGISAVEMEVPARQQLVGSIDGAMRISAVPTPITGPVLARGVTGRAAVGLPALLQPWTVTAKARISRRAVGRPAVTSTGGTVPWVVQAKGLGRRTV